MIVSYICAVLILVFILYFYIGKCHKKSTFPPGPLGIPIFGNLHQIAVNAPLKLSNWVEQFGKLYTISIGATPAVVVSDPQLMRQLFGTIESTGRFQSELWDQLFEGHFGVTGTEGQQWLEQRNFFVKTLRKFGFGRASQMEPMILSEIENVQQCLDTEMLSNGKVHLGKIFKQATGNLLLALITGEKRETNIVKILDDWQKTIQVASGSGIDFFPWLKYFVPNWSGYNAYMKAVTNVHKFVADYFQEHSVGNSNQEHHDVICAYIEHWENTKEKDSTFYGENGYKSIFHSVLSILLAGSETTSTMLNWLIFYLCVNPKVQRKVQEEIDEVIGDSRDPSLKDLRSMPYCEAVIQEALRMSSIAPLGFFHRLLDVITFQDYTFPKDTLLISNLYHVHNDKTIWGDPENFRPERFLEGESQEQKRLREHVVSFMPGKRVCLGEQMAREILFLFLTKLLKEYNFEKEGGRSCSEYVEPIVGFFMSPRDFGVVVTIRN